MRGRDNAKRRASGVLHQRGDPDFKADTNLEQQPSFPDGDEITRFRGIGMFVFIAVQQGGYLYMGPANLLSQILQDRNSDDDVERLSRRGGKGQRCGEQPQLVRTPEEKGQSEI